MPHAGSNAVDEHLKNQVLQVTSSTVFDRSSTPVRCSCQWCEHQRFPVQTLIPPSRVRWDRDIFSEQRDRGQSVHQQQYRDIPCRWNQQCGLQQHLQVEHQGDTGRTRVRSQHIRGQSVHRQSQLWSVLPGFRIQQCDQQHFR